MIGAYDKNKSEYGLNFGDAVRHSENLKINTECMDWPMLYTGNPYKIVPGNVFFVHMILMDSGSKLAMNLGETYLITENGNERLGKQKLNLVIF